jgi:hypothetical protein
LGSWNRTQLYIQSREAEILSSLVGYCISGELDSRTLLLSGPALPSVLVGVQ